MVDLAHCGLAISLRQFMRAGFIASALGRFRLGSSMSTADFINTGSALPARCHGRLGSASLIVGILRAGQQLDQGSCLPIGGFARFDFPLSTFYSARPGLCLLVLDLLHLGSVLSPREYGRLDSVASALDFLHLGLILLPQSFACTGGLVLALEVASFGTLLPLQGSTCLGFRLLVLGTGWLGLSPPACDWVYLDSPLLTKGFSHPDFRLLAPRLAHSDSMLPVQSTASLEALLLSFGAA